MVKDILNHCLKLLDKRDLLSIVDGVIDKSNLNDELERLSEFDKKDILLLVDLIPNVVNSITRSYCPCYVTEKMVSDENKRIYFKDAKHVLMSVKDVSDELNNPIVFHAYFDSLSVPYKNASYFVTYSYETQSFSSLFDECVLPLGITSFIVALGVVSLYLSVKLLYAEAEMFESRFISELESVKPNSGSRNFFVWRN